MAQLVPKKSWKASFRAIEGNGSLSGGQQNITHGYMTTGGYPVQKTSPDKNYETLSWDYGNSTEDIVRPSSRTCMYYIRY